MAFSLPVTGFANETDKDTNDDNNTFTNCVAVDCRRGFQLQDGRNCSIINCSAINCAGDGVRNNNGGISTTFKNILSTGNGGDGFINNGGSYSYFGYNGYYNNAGGDVARFTRSANDRSDNPELVYPIRIEASSTYKNAGEAGADIGANVVKRYVDGSLTDQDLWPWPYEDWIREDMQKLSRRGFCADGQTLTNYIWGYLGNSPPVFTSNQGSTSPQAPTGLAILK
jgi:hypothetical protein